jgi:hypothetical protein
VPAAAVSTTPGDFRANLGWIGQRDLGPAPPLSCANPGPSDVEDWAVFHAAYAALDGWVAKNVTPGTTPPIQVTGPSTSPAGTWSIVRDGDGFAVGGIRLPAVAAPTALNNGENQPTSLANPLNGFCVLYGTHRPYDSSKLPSLYSSHRDYVSKVTQAADALARQGLLLKPDEQTLIHAADASPVGR